MSRTESSPPRCSPSVDEILTLTPLADDAFRADRFQKNHVQAVFGGCLLGQALGAALATAPDRPPSALFARYLAAGDPSRPIDYVVERTREGRSFSERRVIAIQGQGRRLFEAMVTLHTPENGFDHSQPPIKGADAPETLASARELKTVLAGAIDPDEAEAVAALDSLDVRLIRPADYFTRLADAPMGRFWIRASDGAPKANGYAVLAYLSDFMMPATSGLTHVRSAYDPSVASLSLNHALWFHAEPQPDGWFLHEAESPWAGSGRGLSFGRLYDRDGRLLACTSQEMLMRRHSQ